MTEEREFDFVSCSTTNQPQSKTGSWRRITPSFQDRVSPCTDQCPCAEKIPTWMDLVAKNKFEAAWRALTDENPFPLICGRVCYRFCEQECNRKGIDDRVSINAVERFLGEYAVTHNLRPLIPTKRDATAGAVRVAVIGGGPAGLSAAHFIARAGYPVTIFDENEELGGVLRYGIPEYRMPKELLRSEIANMVTGIGVQSMLGCRVDSELLYNLRGSYDYIVVALGAHKEKKLFGVEVGGALLEGGLQFLSKISSGTLKRLPEHVKRVVVIGGGNTAIDVSRSALRLGAEAVTIVYRRTEEAMPAHKDEVELAKKEGVQFMFLTAPRSAKVTDTRGTQLDCVRMVLEGGTDESGRKKPVEVPNSAFAVTGDLVISAIGEEADTGAILPENYHFETERDIADAKILCVGDALYGPRSVSEAIASGKLAAQMILERVRGVYLPITKPDVVREGDVKFYYLNVRRKDPTIANEKELTREEFVHFAETTSTITPEMAATEAARCINCGTCIACDRCLNFCPDFSITKNVDGKYSIDLDYCKGCGLCAEVCERNAISYGKDGSNV